MRSCSCEMIFWAMSRSPRRIFSGRPIESLPVARLFDHDDVGRAFGGARCKRQICKAIAEKTRGRALAGTAPERSVGKRRRRNRRICCNAQMIVLLPDG